MLAPPPDGRSRDDGALEEAGRQRYLSSLERRLGTLEGGGSRRRNQLTSKDILRSLSEAKDDYMQQRVPEMGQHRTGRESPFSIRNEFADVDLSSGGGSEGGSGGVDIEGRRKERVKFKSSQETRPPSGGSIWTCCFRCQGSRRGYRRAGRIEDEDSRLVDCDELSLEWQSEDLNDVT